MQNYLFVHFREKTSPDGEQVYFAISRDGFNWEALNDGQPILWAYYGMRSKYKHSWREINLHGSKDLAHWWSDDLVHWSEQEMIRLGDEGCGCIWAPDIIYDPEYEDYVLHWSYSHAENNYGPMAIYYSRTKDFVNYTKPALLYRKEDSGCIDSAMYVEDGKYYLFVKSEKNPARMIELVSDHVTGPWTKVDAFDASMEAVQAGLYEAPTAVRLDDGRWCLFIDYYGVKGAGQGYVPFVADSMASGKFVRSDEKFHFPYGFKHGTLLTITEEEYDRMKTHNWNDVPDNR